MDRSVRSPVSPLVMESQGVSVFFQDNAEMQGHARKTFRDGVISVLSRAINAVIQVASVILLARLLTPEDYGLVAMVTAVSGFAPMIVDFGTRDALAQREKISEGEVSSLFWITLSAGFACALLIASSGPLMADFYHESRLTYIALASSATVIGSAIVCQHQGLLRRAMMFREISIVETAANVVGAVTAITMAFHGSGYWALVLRPVVTSYLLVGGIWYLCPWLPGKPVVTSGVKAMLRFGVNLVGFTVLDFFSRSIDSIVIGRTYGAERLGFYRKALLVYDNTLDLNLALHNVASVSLSKLRGRPEELRRLWAKGLSVLAFFAMPVFGAMSVTAQDLIVLLLRDRWANAGVLLSVLALKGIPHVVERTLGWLHVAAGRSDRWMRWGLVSAGVQVVALLCGLPFGPMGIATAYVVAMFLLFVPTVAYAGKPVGIGARDVVSTVWRPLAGTLVAVAVGFALRFTLLSGMERLPRLMTLSVLFTVVYLVTVVGILAMRQPISVLFSLLPLRRNQPRTSTVE